MTSYTIMETSTKILKTQKVVRQLTATGQSKQGSIPRMSVHRRRMRNANLRGSWHNKTVTHSKYKLQT